MAITINGSANTIAGLAVGGLPDGTVDNDTLANNASDSAEIAAGAVDLAHLSATGTASSSTYLRGDNAWAAIAGGGIENIDTWYPPSNWNSSSGTTYMTAWNQATDTAYGHIGGDMSHSSGVFTFPATGMWLIFFRHWLYRQNGSNKSVQNMIELTKNNGTNWAQYGRGSNNQYNASGDGNGVVYDSVDAYCVLDITSTSDCKVRFGVDTQAAVTHFGGAVYDTALFIKLCDT